MKQAVTSIPRLWISFTRCLNSFIAPRPKLLTPADEYLAIGEKKFTVEYPQKLTLEKKWPIKQDLSFVANIFFLSFAYDHKFVNLSFRQFISDEETDEPKVWMINQF